MNTQQEMTLADFELSSQTKRTNELFTESVDDLINRIDAVQRTTKNDIQRAHLKATARRIEDAVIEVGAILSALDK